jgi:hypothetical protein
MITEALKEMDGCTPDTFAEQNSRWVDEICEAHDGMGMLKGWLFRMDGGVVESTGVPAVDLVFDHGIVSAYLPSLVVYSSSHEQDCLFYTIDGVSPKSTNRQYELDENEDGTVQLRLHTQHGLLDLVFSEKEQVLRYVAGQHLEIAKKVLVEA